MTNQLKILPTAAFSVVALNRALRPQQWLSLPLLALGVAVVNLSSSSHGGGPKARLGEASEAAVLAAAGGAGLAARLRWWAGLGAALAAALCSGYSSVAVERLLKMEERAATAEGADSKAHRLEEGSSGDSGDAEKAPPGNSAEPQLPLSAPGGDAVQPPHQEQHHGRPLLTLNLQLAGWGALISALQLVAFSGSAVRSSGLTANFNAFTWAVILLQALGGLVVGVVLKYTDNIVKGFATAASILLSFVLESIAAGRSPTLMFVVGLMLVVASFALFSGPEDLLSHTLGPRGYALAAAAAADTAAAAVACARGACSPAAPPARAGALLAAAAGVAGCLAVTALYLHDAPPPPQLGPAPPLLLPGAVLQRNASVPSLLLPLAPPVALADVLSSEAGGAGLGGAAAAAAAAADDDYSTHAAPLAAALTPSALEANASLFRVPGDDVRAGEAAASAFATDVSLLAGDASARGQMEADYVEWPSDGPSWSVAANISVFASPTLPSPTLLDALGRDKEKRRVPRNGTVTELLPARLDEADATRAEFTAARAAAKDDAARTQQQRAQSLLATATDQGGAVLGTLTRRRKRRDVL